MISLGWEKWLKMRNGPALPCVSKAIIAVTHARKMTEAAGDRVDVALPPAAKAIPPMLYTAGY